MHVTMVKKRLLSGAECAKCGDAVTQLKSRGLWGQIDEVVWALEDDSESAGMVLARKWQVDRAPFFLVTDAHGTTVYTSVLQLIREKLGQTVSVADQVRDIDPDDIGI
jgi:hypothetical protein